MANYESRKKSHNLIKLNEYIRLRYDEHLDDKEISKRMKTSIRQVQRYCTQIPTVLFTDEYKMKLTLKFFSIWSKRILDAENDYNNMVKKIDKHTGELTIDTQARAQFSKVLNDTLKEADRFLSKASLLDSDKSVIEHKLSYNSEDIKKSISDILSKE